jgi:hypothetical protein
VDFLPGAPVEIVSMAPDSAFKAAIKGLICRNIQLRNTTASDVVLNSQNLNLRENYYFTIPQGQLPKTVAAGQTVTIEVCFSPDTTRRYQDMIDLFQNTGCGSEVEIIGYGIAAENVVPTKCGMELESKQKSTEVYPKIDVAPNPSDGTFDIYISEIPDGGASVEIINAYGESIESRNNISQQESFDASHISDGIYFIVIKGNNFTATMKIMIIR